MHSALPRLLLPALALVTPLAGQTDDLREQSKHAQLRDQVRIGPSGNPQWITLLSRRISITAPVSVLIVSDGSFFPERRTKPRATLRLFVNGSPVGNESSIDWGGTIDGAEVQHCFNCLAAPLLTAPERPSNYHIQLRALQDTTAPYYVERAANMSIFIDPADVVLQASPGQTIGPIDPDNNENRLCGAQPTICNGPPFGSYIDGPRIDGPTNLCPHRMGLEFREGSNADCHMFQRIHYNNLDRRTIASVFPLPRNERVFMMASGWSEHDGSSSPTCGGTHGDAMWGIFASGPTGISAPTPYRYAVHRASYTINDLWPGAEERGPMYCHGVTNILPPLPIQISLEASDFPVQICSSPAVFNPVRYNVDGSTTLVALHGGFGVEGFASWGNDSTKPCCDSFCIAGNCSPMPCPCLAACTRIRTANGLCRRSCFPTNTPRQIVRRKFVVPENHDGRVFFSAKGRAQGDGCDDAMTIWLWLEVDGVRRGSIGIQKLAGQVATGFPTSVSQRTMSASYLATGEHRLRPGAHEIALYALVSPGGENARVRHLAFYHDLPLLIWFG